VHGRSPDPTSGPVMGRIFADDQETIHPKLASAERMAIVDLSELREGLRGSLRVDRHRRIE